MQQPNYKTVTVGKSELEAAIGEHDTACIERYEPEGNHDGVWNVLVQRRDRIVQRRFRDGVYGSSKAALQIAITYRDAVMAILPPMTNREHAVRLRKNNTTGIPGIYRIKKWGGKAYWEAMLSAAEGVKRKSFSVEKHGEEEAKALAIDQRKKWLAEWPAAFFGAVSKHTDAFAREHFAWRLAQAPDVVPHSDLSDTQIDVELAAVDARFDALRPPRLRVSVRKRSAGRLIASVSDAGKPARSRQKEVGLRRQPLAEALDKVRHGIEAIVTALYNADVARWFMNEHGRQRLDPQCFSPKTGFSVYVYVPRDLVSGNP